MSKRVDLVFRSVGERTSELALELAIRAIQPDRVHVLRDVFPFKETVRQQLAIPHDCDSVVYVDADCLILEDMRPFLEFNDMPYVDCYVQDRFRGRIHCGVHITRIDLVRAMAEVQPDPGDLAYVLRPESAVRNRALRSLGLNKKLFGFHILHDHHQSWTSLFEKYALRELRSRTDRQRARLQAAMATWTDADDHRVARHAVAHARQQVPPDAPPQQVDAYIEALPATARAQIPALGLPPQPPLTLEDLPPFGADRCRPKVFGLGLSRTGTRSLTMALHILGWHTVHYPTDAGTLATLMRGDGRFPLLEQYHGLTDITTAPVFAELDALYPDARFVLTVRDEESWLQSCARHWEGRPSHDDPSKDPTHMEIRRLLRAATYGCYGFDPERFRRIHREHVARVRRHFADRRGKLLELPLVAGAGWGPLCDFLGVDVPHEPFPHKGGGLKRKARRGLETMD